LLLGLVALGIYAPRALAVTEAWEVVGTAGFSPGTAWYPSFKLDSANTPYVGFADGANSSKATVMKLDGSTWGAVGNAGFSAGAAYYTSLAMDSNNTPYLAFSDGGK